MCSVEMIHRITKWCGREKENTKEARKKKRMQRMGVVDVAAKK